MVRASFAVVVTSESGDNRCVQSESQGPFGIVFESVFSQNKNENENGVLQLLYFKLCLLPRALINFGFGGTVSVITLCLNQLTLFFLVVDWSKNLKEKS